MLLMPAISIWRTIGRGGPWNRNFFGLWNGTERCECHFGQKNRDLKVHNTRLRYKNVFNQLLKWEPLINLGKNNWTSYFDQFVKHFCFFSLLFAFLTWHYSNCGVSFDQLIVLLTPYLVISIGKFSKLASVRYHKRSNYRERVLPPSCRVSPPHEDLAWARGESVHFYLHKFELDRIRLSALLY